MSSELATGSGRSRPSSGGLRTFLSWIRGEDKFRESSPSDSSSGASDHTTTSFAYVSPASYRHSAFVILPSSDPPTESYRRRLRDRDHRRYIERDLTLRTKYYLHASENINTDALSLPNARQFDNELRVRRATSECASRRSAYVPGKRQAPPPPPVSASPVTVNLSRRTSRKRPAPQPPVITSVEVNVEKNNNSKSNLDKTVAEHKKYAQSSIFTKNKKCNVKNMKSKKTENNVSGSFTFLETKENNHINTNKRSNGYLPSISELDRQATEILQLCKDLNTKDNMNILVQKTNTQKIETMHLGEVDQWTCVHCKNKNTSKCIICLSCYSNKKLVTPRTKPAEKIMLTETENIYAGKGHLNKTVAFGINSKEPISDKTKSDMPQTSQLCNSYTEKQKLKEILKQMKHSLPKYPQPGTDFNHRDIKIRDSKIIHNVVEKHDFKTAFTNNEHRHSKPHELDNSKVCESSTLRVGSANSAVGTSCNKWSELSSPPHFPKQSQNIDLSNSLNPIEDAVVSNASITETAHSFPSKESTTTSDLNKKSNENIIRTDVAHVILRQKPLKSQIRDFPHQLLRKQKEKEDASPKRYSTTITDLLNNCVMDNNTNANSSVHHQEKQLSVLLKFDNISSNNGKDSAKLTGKPETNKKINQPLPEANVLKFNKTSNENIQELETNLINKVIFSSTPICDNAPRKTVQSLIVGSSNISNASNVVKSAKELATTANESPCLKTTTSSNIVLTSSVLPTQLSKTKTTQSVVSTIVTPIESSYGSLMESPIFKNASNIYVMPEPPNSKYSNSTNLIKLLENAISRGDEVAAAEVATKLAQLRLPCSMNYVDLQNNQTSSGLPATLPVASTVYSSATSSSFSLRDDSQTSLPLQITSKTEITLPTMSMIKSNSTALILSNSQSEQTSRSALKTQSKPTTQTIPTQLILSQTTSATPLATTPVTSSPPTTTTIKTTATTQTISTAKVFQFSVTVPPSPITSVLHKMDGPNTKIIPESTQSSISENILSNKAVVPRNNSPTARLVPEADDSMMKLDVLIEDKEMQRGPVTLHVKRDAILGTLRITAESTLGLPSRLQRWIIGRHLCTDDSVALTALAGPDLDAPFYLCVVDSESTNGVETKHTSHNDLHVEGVYPELVRLERCALIPNVEQTECGVCLEECPIGNGAVLRECLHSYCRACLASAVQHSQEPIVGCPALGCTGIIQEREIRALVSREDYERWLARGLAAAESGARHAFHCRTKDCIAWTLYEPGVTRFPCPVCNHINCITCEAIHEGETCDEHRTRILQEVAAEAVGARATDKDTHAFIKELVLRGEAMECPDCKAIITKKWGCDWVRCSACKTEICWVTRGPRWGPKGNGDTSAGCKCGVNGRRCHPTCNYCH